MYATIAQRQGSRWLAGLVFLAMLFLAALSSVASPGTSRAAASVPCPVTASELTTLVGKSLQRVNLAGVAADPVDQCAFSALAKVPSSHFVSPQVFLTVDPGSATDLRELYLYYVKSRNKLAARLQLSARPDLGKGAFTLTAAAMPVMTTFFLAGNSGVGTLVVDLSEAGAGKRDQGTAEKIFGLVANRLH
jgi:hypothetical protein